MSLPRFFVAAPLALGLHDLPEAQAHYLSRVLRLNVGAKVQLFDGSGKEYRGELSSVTKKTVQVNVQECLDGLPESSLHIHLGQGLSRGERMDWAIQKATELGVAEITPLFTERCEVRLNDERAQKRLEHWQHIAISACEQCGRSKVPVIHPPQSLKDWQTRVEADLKLLLHPVAQPLTEHATPSTLAFLIGPEGGLTEDEVTQASQFGFQPARLGPRVLRTETAPVVALSVAQQLWGDF